MTVSHIFPNKMAGTMVLFWISLVLSVIGSDARHGGELSILHSPDSLKFSGASETNESLLKEIFSASLGLSVGENTDWKGLSVTDPFKTPEAVVEVYIDGVSSLGNSIDSKYTTYPLKVELEPDTFEAVAHRIRQRYPDGGNKILEIELSDPKQLSSEEFVKVFGETKVPKVLKQSLSHLKYSVEEHYQFLHALEILKTITEKVANGDVKADNKIDLYHFRFRSLHALSDRHDPLETKEAKKLLGDALQELSRAFVKAYDGAVLVAAVASDIEHTRVARAADDPEPAAQLDEIDPDDYDADYPAIFNIILWFALVLVFVLISIVYAIMDMDPGRDSIIYRMTSTRMKKDN